MRRRKSKRYFVLTAAEAALALHALLSFRNKVIGKGIDTVDMDRLIKKLI